MIYHLAPMPPHSRWDGTLVGQVCNQHRLCNRPLKKDQLCKKYLNIYRQVHHQVELGVVARVGGVERAVGHEALVQHVLVAGHAHHLRLLLEVEVDGPAEVRREVGY